MPGIYSFESYPVRRSVDPRMVGQLLVAMRQQQEQQLQPLAPQPQASAIGSLLSDAGSS